MKFSARWKAAFDARDRQAFEDMLHDDFAFIRHQLGKDLHKAEMVNIWSADGPRPVRRNYRVIYENDDILVTHQFIEFPSGDKESVIVVMLLKDGQLYRMETGATPMV